MVHVAKLNLTHNLSHLCASLAFEVSRTVSDGIWWGGEAKTEINISQKLLKIVAIVSGHVFLGPDLCRQEEYPHAIINLTSNLFIPIAAVKSWLKLFAHRPKYWIPQIKTVNEHRPDMQQSLIPVLRETRALRAKGEEPPKDM